jgi:hypothetical protein
MLGLNSHERKHRLGSEGRESGGSRTSELRSGSIEQQQRTLLRLKCTDGAVENLARSLSEFVIRRGHRSDVSNGPKDGEETSELRILVHHRRSDGFRQSKYNIALGIGQPKNM